MGIYDREYVRDGRGGGGFGGGGMSPRARLSGWSFNTWLIAINVAVFVLQAIVFRPYQSSWTGLSGDWLFQWGHFSTRLGFGALEVWRLISFQFLHANLWHIGFNMIGLYFFGGLVEQYLGKKRYAAFYLMCGLCGGLLYLLLNLVGYLGLPLPGALGVDPRTPLVGASAGVFGVIIACAFIAPTSVVQLLFPPIPLKMRTFAYGYVALAAANLLFFKGANQGGDAAHLGGAIAGFFFIRRPHLLREFFDVFGNSGKPRGRPGPAPGRKARKADDAEVDRVLDKVRREGLHSLNGTEKKTLQQATDERRG
jgi:membrane associated rhomboid family serine protease